VSTRERRDHRAKQRLVRAASWSGMSGPASLRWYSAKADAWAAGSVEGPRPFQAVRPPFGPRAPTPYARASARRGAPVSAVSPPVRAGALRAPACGANGRRPGSRGPNGVHRGGETADGLRPLSADSDGVVRPLCHSAHREACRAPRPSAHPKG
jgi:hypothetical protein